MGRERPQIVVVRRGGDHGCLITILLLLTPLSGQARPIAPLEGLEALRRGVSGISDFTALFSAENRPVTELANEGSARVVIAEGIAKLDASLTSPHPDWPISDRSEDPGQ